MVVADNLAPYLDKDMLNVGTEAMDVGFSHVLFWICEYPFKFLSIFEN
jgi:hypothetical protein